MWGDMCCGVTSVLWCNKEMYIAGWEKEAREEGVEMGPVERARF